MMNGRIHAVAWREFKHTVGTKAFLFAVIGVPFLLAVVLAVATLIMTEHEEPPLVGTMAVTDPTGQLVPAFLLEVERRQDDDPSPLAMPNGAAPPGSEMTMGLFSRGLVDLSVEPLETDADTFERLVAPRIQSGELVGAVLVPAELLELDQAAGQPEFRLLVGEEMDGDHISLIERLTGDAVVRVRVELAGLDTDATRTMLRRPGADTQRLLESGEIRSESAGVRELRQTVIPMIFMMLLWGSTFGTGNQLLMSTIEEKSNKVMEVLLSAVSPLELMAGKIIGQGAVGLIIIGVYSSVGIVSLVAAAALDLIDPRQVVFLFVYYFMAYFMVASLMAAVGSAVSDLREANSLMMPAMILLMIPLLLWMPISQSPNGTLATIFSFIPPVIPFVMVLRIVADEPVVWWQIAATIVWGYICVLGMVWLSAKIFRVGVLMTGKPPSPVELLKWVRYS